jgi:hypothetical protein
MSSRLHRGGADIESQPVAWQRVSPVDAVGEGHYAMETPGVSPSVFPVSLGARGAAEAEQRIRSAHQQGYDEGKEAARKALSGHLEAMQVKLAHSIEEITSLRSRYRHEAE